VLQSVMSVMSTPLCWLLLQVTSGQLAALGVPLEAQNIDAHKLIDTYGKTW